MKTIKQNSLAPSHMLIISFGADPSFLSKHNVQNLSRPLNVQKRAIILIRIIDTTTLGDIVLSRDHDSARAGIVNGRWPPSTGRTGTSADGYSCGLENSGNLKGVVRLIIGGGTTTAGSCITTLFIQ